MLGNLYPYLVKRADINPPLIREDNIGSSFNGKTQDFDFCYDSSILSLPANSPIEPVWIP